MTRRRHTTILLRRELWSLLRERSLYMMLLLQLSVILLTSSFAVGLAAAYGGVAVPAASVRIVIDGDGVAGRFLADSLRQQGVNAISSNLATGIADAILRVTDGAVGERVTVVGVTISQNPRAAFVTRLVRDALEGLEHRLRGDLTSAHPSLGLTELQRRPVGDIVGAFYRFETTYTVLIPMILILPAITAGGLLIDSLTEERERKTLLLLLATPLTLRRIYAAKLLTYFALAVGQLLAWIGLLPLLGIPVKYAAEVIGVLTLLAAFFALLAGLLALEFRTKVLGQTVYSLLAATILLFWYFSPGSPINVLVSLAAGTYTSLTFVVVLLPLVVALILVLSHRLGANVPMV